MKASVNNPNYAFNAGNRICHERITRSNYDQHKRRLDEITQPSNRSATIQAGRADSKERNQRSLTSVLSFRTFFSKESKK